ncbi:lipopolysaccharide biosynthesis protein [Listeria aquatica]|uniref:lipopolysaccharide biosynthesis protein n=1 Tax=Listeria aquatica TaxID=1494960 RepID=UPI003F727554
MKNINEFKKHVGTLISGNVLAQAITFAASPVLTRLYSPEEFGFYATFVSLVSVLSVLFALTFEKCIPLAVNRKIAGQITVLSLKLAACFSVLYIVVVTTTSFSLLKMFTGRTSLWLEIILILSIFSASATQTLNFWHLREQYFASTSRAKVSQNLGNVFSQALFSQFDALRSSGLIIGDAFGRLAAFSMQYMSFIRLKQVKGIFKTKIWSAYIWKKYYRFPLFTSISVLFNALSLQIPILALNQFFNASVAGNFMLTQKVIGIPITLIGTAVAQVFYSTAAKSIDSNPIQVLVLYKKITRNLFFVTLPVFVVFSFIAPFVFQTFFGKDWFLSGQYFQILAVSFFSQLIVLPVSQVLYITNNQIVQTIWDFSRFACFYLIFWSCHFFQIGELSTIGIYTIFSTSFYLLLYLLGRYYISTQVQQHARKRSLLNRN